MQCLKSKSQIAHYIRGILRSVLRLTGGEAHYEERTQRWRAVGGIGSNLAYPGIEPQTSPTDSKALTTGLTGHNIPGNLFHLWAIVIVPLCVQPARPLAVETRAT